MSEAVRTSGVLVYAACVDFMLRLAALLGLTYRDANALVLLVGMPLTTAVLVVVCVWQRVVLRARRRGLVTSAGRSRSSPSPR